MSDSDEHEISSDEPLGSVKMTKKRFRKGRKKFRTSESAARIASFDVAEKKPRLDHQSRVSMKKAKSVRFDPSLDFYVKPVRATKSDSAYDSIGNDLSFMALFKSMKNVIVSTGDGPIRMVKVLVEDAQFWSYYNCYAYERNGGIVIRFYKLPH